MVILLISKLFNENLFYTKSEDNYYLIEEIMSGYDDGVRVLYINNNCYHSLTKITHNLNHTPQTLKLDNIAKIITSINDYLKFINLLKIVLSKIPDVEIVERIKLTNYNISNKTYIIKSKYVSFNLFYEMLYNIHDKNDNIYGLTFHDTYIINDIKIDNEIDCYTINDYKNIGKEYNTKINESYINDIKDEMYLKHINV